MVTTPQKDGSSIDHGSSAPADEAPPIETSRADDEIEAARQRDLQLLMEQLEKELCH